MLTDNDNKERKSYIVLEIETYGTHAQAEATLERLESEVALQRFRATTVAKTVG